MSSKAPEKIANRCSSSSRSIPISRLRNLGVDEDRRSRGVKKQEYPLDDYLINTNTLTNGKPNLLSPMSPVSSPETLDVLGNAERLVKNAQEQIMQVSLNSALNNFEENPSSFIGLRNFDDSLLYVREIVESKFQELNDPDRISGRKTSTSRLPVSNRKLQHDKFPLQESTGMLNRPLGISAQNSIFSTNQLHEKSFFKKESDWLNVEPPKHSTVFPTSPLNGKKSMNKNSYSTRRCAMNNTGVIEIDGTDNHHGTIKIQTGPTLTIRGGLTVQTIENFHISPDPSSVPLHNNIATYCFRHESSSSSNFDDPNRTCAEKKHSTAVTGAGNVVRDTGKEKHIRSTDYNDTEKIMHIENRSDAKIAVTIHSDVPKSINLGESSIDAEKLRDRVISNESVENGREQSEKAVSVDLTPITKSVAQNLSVNDSEGESVNNEIVGEDEGPSENVKEVSLKREFANSSTNEKYKEKQKLQASLEAIANIEKIKYDVTDSGVVPGECTQVCGEENQCLADPVSLEFDALSDPERFKIALENLCKLSQKNKVPTRNNNSKIFEGAIDAFVETFFGSNSRSNSAHGLYSPIVNSEIQGASTTVKSRVNNSDVKKLSSDARTAGDSTSRRFCDGQQKESDVYSKPTVTQLGRLSKKTFVQAKEVSSLKEGEDSLDDLDLTQPCVSDVDEVLKTYRESMSAICQGTEKLSQLISHHIMKNSLSNLKKNSPTSNNLSCNSIKNEKNPIESTLNSVSFASKQIPRETCSNQRQSTTERIRRQLKLSSIPRCNDYSSHHRDDVKLSEGDSSPTGSGSPSEETRTCSEEKRKFNVSDDENNLTNPAATIETYQKILPNIKPQDLPTKRKTSKNQFMDVRYCVTGRSAGFPISTGAVPDKIENSQLKSNLKNPLCTYLNLENPCGKNLRSRRNSNYDIHGDQTADLDVYDIPLLFSGLKNNTLNNVCNDKMTVENSVQQTQEKELQVFGKIIDAMKNSSQFMKWFVVSLFNGIEIDSVNDVVRNLEDAAVHPIIIEQFLVILRERYKERSLLGESIMTASPSPASGDLQEEKYVDKKRDLTKINEDLDNFKKSIRFNTGVEKIDTNVDREAGNSGGLYPIGDCIDANNLERVELDMNSKLMLNRDDAPSIDRSNSQGDRTLGNKFQIDSVQSEIISNKNVEGEDSTNSQERLAIPEQNIENISYKSDSSLKCPTSNLQTSGEPCTELGKKTERDEQKAEVTSRETEICQNNESTLKEQNNLNERLKNSTLINVNSKKNCSSSSTDKDISFILPRDDETNGKLVDSNKENLTSVTLKNEATGRIVGFRMESGIENSLQINPLVQGNDTKMYFKSNSRQSSIAIGKSDGKLNIPDDSPLTNSTDDLRRNYGNNKCYCKVFRDDKTPKIEPRNVPCQSSSDAVNALLNSRMQSEYNQRRSLYINEKSFLRSPDRMTLLSKGAMDKRSRPSKLTSISKNQAKNVADLSKTGNKGNKQSSKKGREDRDSKPGPMKYVNSRESSDSESSNDTAGCQFCIKLRGKCSCFDCVDCMTNSRGRKKVAGKKLTEKEKLVKNATSPRQFNSPKRSGPNTGKYSSPRGPRSTSLESKKNVTICGQGIKKTNEKSACIREVKNFALTRAKTKPRSGLFCGSGSNDNAGPAKNTAKLKKKKNSQDAALDSVNLLRMEDKSQNTAKVFTVCKNTETENITNSERATMSEELEKTFSEKVTITGETSIVQLSSEKFDQDKEIEFGMNPCATQEPIDYSKNTCCEKIDRISEKITKSSGTDNFVTVECQVSVTDNDPQKHEPNNALKSIEEIEKSTVSKITFQHPHIDEESIIVLQPLSEIDHTYFIAKPNCVERMIIEGKLNRKVKTKENQVTDQNCSSVRESNQRIETADRKVTYSDFGINEHVDSIDKATSKSIVQLDRATSGTDLVDKRISQVDCVGDREVDGTVNNKQSNMVFAAVSRSNSDVNFSREKVECMNICTNNGECSRMCSRPSRASDYWEFPCRQDCQNEEVCLILCAPKPQLEQSVQTNSIDINGILERLISDNNVPNLKMPITQAILQELKKFEDILKTGNEQLRTIPERFESQTNEDNTEIKNEREIVTGHEPRCHADLTHRRRRSVQYEEPQERLSHIMQNRKSLILPNVVRGIADMHPSTTLERLKLRSADPLVSGNFNKPEPDKRYSVFNQADPASSAIDLNDPRVQEHLASVAQMAIGYQEERNQSNNNKNNVQQNATKVVETKPTPSKSNEKYSAKLNKSRRGMDADFSPRDGQNGSMKSFESSDLEPGEFLEVRTPFDKPSKSCQSGKRYSMMENQDQLSKEKKVQCHGFCDNDESYDAVKSWGPKVLAATKTQCNTVAGSESTNRPSADNLELDKNSKANNNSANISSNANSKTENPSNSKDFNLKVADDASERVNENLKTEQSDKHSDLERPDDTINCCNRPQIIDYFLGKRNLDEIEVNNTNNNRSDAILNDRKDRRGDNCRQLYMKFNFTSKTTSELDRSDKLAESQDIPADNNNAVELFAPKKRDENMSANSNETGGKHWEQTSSDTYSEGEINLPSSCSYSLGEVKVSTASTTAGKSFEDPDGLTIFVTKSILESTLVTGNSPGEILAEINRTESDFSSNSC